MLPGSSTSLTALFHGCKESEDKFKTTEMCSRRQFRGGRVREVRRLQKTIYRPRLSKQTGTGAPQLSEVAKTFLAALGKQISRKLLPDVQSVIGLWSFTPTDLARSRGTAYRPENIMAQEKDRYPTAVSWCRPAS
ncbi:hypothetical protein TNCV_1274471 [Trichonephila clavipes]|nr:hypothetical protein TNCV_1274471 [Trichonephila clavipes]